MPDQQLWGGETAKAVENFPISGETVPVSVVHWLARIKGAAAAVNGELGLLSKRSATRIEKAAAEIAAGKHDAPVPDRRLPDRLGHLRRTRTPTRSSPRWRRGRAPQRPRQHGPVLQRRVSLRRAPGRARRRPERAAAALKQLERSFAKKAKSFQNVVKAGRTHLMDAVPVTLGQEFAGYAAQMALGQERVASALVHVGQIPLGGTATGTGLNTHPRFAEKVRARLKKESGLKQIAAAAGPVRGAGQPRRARRALRRAEGRGRLAHQDRQRPRADGLRPARRHRRDLPARAAEGLLDHARQGQPGDPRGRPAGLSAGDRQRHRHHRRRHAGPVRAERAHPADRAQPAAVAAPAVHRHARVRREVRRRHRGQQGRRGGLRRSARSPSPPRSTARSATTRAPRSSRRRPSPGGRCARSRSRRASTPSCTTRRSTCERSHGAIAGSI